MKRTRNHTKGSHGPGAGSTGGVSVLVASDWAPIRAFAEPMRRDPEAVYGDLLPILRTADLRIVNCECALTRATRPVWKSGSVFKGSPAHVEALTAVPFEVACLANNHVLDYGVAGLRETIDTLHRHDVLTVGAGLTDRQAHAPLTINIGTAVHVVNFSEGEDLTASDGGPGVFGWDIPRAAASVAECRRRGGAVVVIAHCGLEYVPTPPPYVVRAFHAMIDAGADCVVGHHPHVPQGVEWYRGRPIVYSLGNFAFYQATDLFWRKIGCCAELRFGRPGPPSMRLIPYRIDEQRLRVLSGSAAAEFDRKMRRLSSLLVSARTAEAAWQAYLAHYGTAGFVNEVHGILEKLATEPPKGAAMFRNRVTTMQHRELWIDFLTRVMNGEQPRYSRDAYRLVEEWFGRTLK